MTNVICADLSMLEASAYGSLYERASEERKRRADAYHRREDALRCLTAEALLGHVLGSRDFTVERTPLGKPLLKGKENFHFNLSHSGRWVVLAWGDAPVGVDVEKIRMDAGREKMIRRYFAPEEQAYVLEDPALTAQRFFEVWTGKESWLKYLGTGLRRELNSFSVLSLGPGPGLFTRLLPGGYCLSLCTVDRQYGFRILDARQLVL